MDWFWKAAPENTSSVTSSVEDLLHDVDNLRDEKRDLETQIKDLKQEHRLADELIAHNVKIREEQLAVEHSRKEVKLEREKDKEVAKVRDEYRTKQEETLQKQIDRSNDMYTELLARLPDVNVALTNAFPQEE